jgi:hypothetical protein
MKKLLINLGFAGIVLSLFTSCRTQPAQVVYVAKDSIITKTETVYKDTVITVPGDTIRFQIPCNKDTVFIYKGKASTSMVTVQKGSVTIQNNCDEKDLIITKLREQVDSYSMATQDSSTTIYVKVKHIPGIYKFFTWGFWILAVALGALLYFNQNLWLAAIGLVASLFKKKNKK